MTLLWTRGEGDRPWCLGVRTSSGSATSDAGKKPFQTRHRSGLARRPQPCLLFLPHPVPLLRPPNTLDNRSDIVNRLSPQTKRTGVHAMASNGGAVLDPLEQMGAVVNAPANSKEQAEMLAALRELLEGHPTLATVCSGFALNVLSGPDSLLRRWALDLVHFAICKSALSTDVRTKRAWLLFLPFCLALALATAAHCWAGGRAGACACGVSLC